MPRNSEFPAISIDVGWLISLDQFDYESHVAAVEFLNRLIRESTSLLIDFDGRIVAEYERNIDPSSEGGRFFQQCLKIGLVEYQASKPTKVCAQGLEHAGFDPSDVPYIAVAQRAAAPFLAIEKKHLAEAMREKVLTACGVRIVTLQEIVAP